ncbi:hypothetical protein DY000_02049399 [Brassica cretica]|uniref:Uncharacterized protein n=1 Tax=Brassica cretica TaxID=69181 RepID=A0ABQ7F222_BRACR|nr:hypothetical protein DY000_02049399 [Brassica cretica]
MGFSSSLIHPYEATKTETNHEAQTNTTTNQNTKEGFRFTFRFDFIWACERDFICFFIIEEIDTESHRKIHQGELSPGEITESSGRAIGTRIGADSIEERSSMTDSVDFADREHEIEEIDADSPRERHKRRGRIVERGRRNESFV